MARSGAHAPMPLARWPRRARAIWVRSVAPIGRVAAEALGRGLDVLLAVSLLAVSTPLLLVCSARARLRAGRVLDRTRLVGRFREPFERLSFAGGGFGTSLPMLWNVMRGDLSFTGPRPLSAEEAERVPPHASVRFEVRPGLVGPHSLRRRANIAYDSEAETDREFVYGQTLKNNAGLLARAVPGMVLGGGGDAKPAPPTLDMLGVRMVNTTMDEALDWIASAARGAAPSQMAFVNPDCLNVAYRNQPYREVLAACSRVLPDGIGVHLACRMQGKSLKANLNGTDLFPRLCQRAVEERLSLYLLGARPGVAAAAGESMQKRFPGLSIAGARDGYFRHEEEDAVVDEINRSGADVLLVAFGAPRQDLWLAGLRDRLRPPLRMGVGGLFDYYSGRIRRAPHWVREIGMEWLWRTMQEPGRLWKRYFVGNPLFLWRIWREIRRDPPGLS